MIHLDIAHGVARVTLDRPPVNAFDGEQLDRFATLTADLRERDDVSVAVVRGAGAHFCAGADIDMLRDGMTDEVGIERLVAFATHMQGVWVDWVSLPIPTVAVLDGAATGGGFELALACDLRIAATDARIGLPEVRLGLLAAAGGTQRLTRLVGPGRAARLMLRGEIVDGPTAEQWGLVEWSGSRDEIDALTDEVVGSLLEVAGPAHAAIKRCIALEGSPEGYATETSSQRQLHDTDESRERIDAFLERRARR